MSCCTQVNYNCQNGFNLGTYGHCQLVTLPLCKYKDGKHYAQIKSSGLNEKYLLECDDVGKFIIDMKWFNELNEECFQIIDPDGEVYVATICENTGTPCEPHGEEIEICYHTWYLRPCIEKINESKVEIEEDIFVDIIPDNKDLNC